MFFGSIEVHAGLGDEILRICKSSAKDLEGGAMMLAEPKNDCE